MGTRLSRYIYIYIYIVHKLSLTELSSDNQTFKVLKVRRIIFRVGDSCHWLDVCHINLSPKAGDSNSGWSYYNLGKCEMGGVTTMQPMR